MDFETTFNKLIKYSKNGNLDEIKKLNLNLEDIRSIDNYALRWASTNGHLEVVKFLIDKGLTLEDIRSQDNSAFIWASYFGNLEIVKYLVNKGLTLDDIRSQDNLAFRYASRNAYLEVVKFLEETISSSGGASPKEMIEKLELKENF